MDLFRDLLVPLNTLSVAALFLSLYLFLYLSVALPPFGMISGCVSLRFYFDMRLVRLTFDLWTKRVYKCLDLRQKGLTTDRMREICEYRSNVNIDESIDCLTYRY